MILSSDPLSSSDETDPVLLSSVSPSLFVILGMIYFVGLTKPNLRSFISTIPLTNSINRSCFGLHHPPHCHHGRCLCQEGQKTRSQHSWWRESPL